MIDGQSDLERLAERLAREPELAVDCEMDAMFAYRTRICLVQIGWPGGEALIDVMAELDLAPLGRLFDDPAIVKIFHSGENDIGLMTEQWGLRFQAIFDTMAASQVLGHQGVGLAAVLDRHFDVKLSKKYQKADWRVRPLPPEQEEYARMDVRYLIPLRHQLLAELEQKGRVDEAECDFRRIATARIEDKPFDPEAWGKVKGGKDLPADRRGVIKELYAARDAIARRLDRAPYRVLQDSGLVALARALPTSPGAYQRLKGVNRRLAPADLRLLLEAVARGRELGEIPVPRRPRGRRPWDAAGREALGPEQEKLFEALRAWRTDRARRRGVDVARVATTALLAAIARVAPRTPEELHAVEGVEPWRVREYGEEILAVVEESPA